MKYLNLIKNWLQTIAYRQQGFLLGSIVLILILSAFGIYWALSPAYGVLFNHLDAQDAGKIIAKLEVEQIPYQVKNQGSDILIDQRLVDKTRIQIIGSDLQLTSTVGFELFDKNDFGMSNFSQKINYQRALQGELERTIRSLDEIQQVRVHLVIPEPHLFEQQDNLPRAAVTVHLKQPLAPHQVKSIQQLIAASVPQLAPQNVIIVDQNGNNLIVTDDEGSLGHFNEKKKIEHYLNQKVLHLLERIFPRHQVMVKIDVTLNYDQLQRELEKPNRHGIVVHEKETQHALSEKNSKTPPQHDFTRETRYQFGHEKEHFTRANGTIERLTISVVVPRETPKAHIEQVERLVKSVIGFQASRGDTISVEALLLDTKSITPSATPQQSLKRTARASPISWVQIIAGLCLFGFSSVYWYATGRKRKPQPSDASNIAASPAPGALPDYCRQLAALPPLYIAIILSQGAYIWQTRFLEQYDPEHRIQTLMTHELPCIKANTQQTLFNEWMRTLPFATQLGGNHGDNS